MAAETPKSATTTTGSPAATASRVAVEDTVTKAAADASASDIEPALNRTASATTRPSRTSSAHSSG